jgi:ribonucleoside-diphosphate reductase alpha chain
MYAHTKVTVMCICAASFGSSKKERAKLTNSIYKPEGLAKTIFQDRYTITPEESWEEASLRLARHSASVEEPHNRGQVQESFNEIIATNKFMPGGRIWYGSERPRAQLLNCFVVPTHDSREGWGKTISDVIVVSGMGGGVGINMSPIRPRGSRINGTGGYATGAVSLMEMIDGVGNIIMDGGGRRMALMLDLNITHPDMPEFLDKKLDRDKLQNANISIVLDKRVGTKALIDKVQNNKNIDLVFGGTHYDSINAKELWGKIVNNAWKSGEPGILNGDLANRESNIFYHKPMVSTNPCGEIWLEEYGCCDLGALVLPRFINEFGTVDWDDLAKTVHTAVRFLDNVLSVNEYPLPEIRENCNTVRRIGLGIMGLHSMLIELGYKYSSDSAKAFVDELMGFIKNEAYKASIALAIEKGPFPAYDEQMLQSGFMKRAISSEIKSQIKKHGIRNCALLTIAPTGTTGMVSNVSTGIEPLFSAAYWRRFYRPSTEAKRVRDKELVVDPLWTKLEQEGKDISVLEGAYDITPEGHFEMQVIAQNHIDNAVSKTINLPENYPVESLGDVWLEYLPKVKGATLYRAGSRGEEPLEAIPLDEARELMRLKHEHSDSSITEQNSMDCPDGVCEIPEELKPHITEQVIQFVG